MVSQPVRPDASFRRSAAGRADLLYLLDALPAMAPALLAELLGYAPLKPAAREPEVSQRRSQDSQPQSVAGERSREQSGSLRRHPPVRFFRIRERQLLVADPPSAAPPPELAQARSLSEQDRPEMIVLGQPLRGPDLAPWSRLWPFLRLVLGARNHSRRLDVPRLVRTLAQGRPLRRMPLLPRLGWTPVCHVLVDRDLRLAQFWDDFLDLCADLYRLRGGSGLQVHIFEQGPDGPCRPWVPSRRKPLQTYTFPEPGTPVLVLSDLGCLDGRTAPWSALGRRLHRAGHRPVALMPCPERYWGPEVKRWFLPLVWDRGRRYPSRVLQAPERCYLDPDVAAQNSEFLLDLLAPALQVEPALLRAVRYLRPAGELDVGCEASAWRHADLRYTPLGGCWTHEALERRRTAFRALGTSPLQGAVRHLIRRHHTYLVPAQRALEELVLAELEGRRELDDQARSFLRDLYATLQRAPGWSRISQVEAWINRASRQLHQGVWSWQAARPLAAAVAQLAVRRAEPGQDPSLPEGFDYRQVLWALEAPGQGGPYRLMQNGRSLHLEADRDEPSGSPLMRFQLDAGWVQWQHQDAQGNLSPPHLRELARREPMATPKEGALILQAGSQILIIDGIPCPEWAEAIGRDAQGLWVQPKGQDRERLRWADPGALELWDRQQRGEPLARFERNQGCYMAELEYLALRDQGFRQPGWADAFGVDEYGIWAEFHFKGVRQRLRWIWPGEFLMGSPETEPERLDNETQHLVLLTQGYWLADTACTQALWQAVMGNNPSNFKGAERPVEQVSWDDARGFLERLNQDRPALELRLPSEAEWEYACRAGTATPFWFGDNLSTDQANYDGNYPYAEGTKGEYRRETVEVRALPANAWGLYQMHGNVWEWCLDSYQDYPEGQQVDPLLRAMGSGRVLRGGGWYISAGWLRSAFRLHREPGSRDSSAGFRLARGRKVPGGASQ